MNLLDLAIVFLTLGITEAVVKPLAKRWVQRRIPRAAPAILRAIDASLPELLALPTGEALEARVRAIAEEAPARAGRRMTWGRCLSCLISGGLPET